MIRNKGPLFLDENWAIEQPEKIKETVNKTQEKITIEDVNNEIIIAIQNILEIKNLWENIDTLISYLDLFGFDINNHIVLDNRVVNDSKITYRYKLSIEGEKSIIRLLTYQEAKKLIAQKLESWINFTSLNKKLRYLNSNKGQNIKISDNYNEAELNEILKISEGLSTDNKLSNQISELIKKLRNQDEYRARLEVINQAIISVNFYTITQSELVDLSGEKIQNPEDTFSIYRSIILEAEQWVKSNYTEINYSYSEENTEYIESKREEKKKKITEQEEKAQQELEDKINLEKQRNNKKIAKRTVIAWMFWVLIWSWIVLDKEYWKEEVNNKQELNSKNIEDYANNLYDELILNKNLDIRNNIKNHLDPVMDDIFKFYSSETYVWITGMKLRELLINLWYNNLWTKVSYVDWYVEISLPDLWPEVDKIRYKVIKNNNFIVDTQFSNPWLYREIFSALEIDIKVASSINDFQDTIDGKLQTILEWNFWSNFKDYISVISYRKSDKFHVEIHNSQDNIIFKNIVLSLPSHLR